MPDSAGDTAATCCRPPARAFVRLKPVLASSLRCLLAGGRPLAAGSAQLLGREDGPRSGGRDGPLRRPLVRASQGEVYCGSELRRASATLVLDELGAVAETGARTFEDPIPILRVLFACPQGALDDDDPEHVEDGRSPGCLELMRPAAEIAEPDSLQRKSRPSVGRPGPGSTRTRCVSPSPRPSPPCPSGH